jgi:hypothetical protein
MYLAMPRCQPLVYIVYDEELDEELGEGRDESNLPLSEKLKKAHREWAEKMQGRTITVVRIPDTPDRRVA